MRSLLALSCPSSRTWLRFLQIGVRIIAIGLLLCVIIYLGVGTVSFLLAATLLVVGFERVATGFLPNHSKFSRMGNLL